MQRKGIVFEVVLIFVARAFKNRIKRAKQTNKHPR